MSTNALAKRGSLLPVSFNDFFKPWEEWFNTNGWFNNMLTVPSANIVESQNRFTISLAAPGLRKNDFTIHVDGDLLTISAEKEENKETKEEKVTRKEYNYSSFSRSFTLPDGVDKDHIEAEYADGILVLELPKTDEAKKLFYKNVPVG